jgi:hypothetical protein
MALVFADLVQETSSTTGVPFGYWDYGSSVVMNGVNGDTFTVNLDATNGVFSVT